jgi:hypothetical protein
MEAALAILDTARAHCAMSRGAGSMKSAEAWLSAARTRSEAAWSDEVQVILRRARRRYEDSEKRYPAT